jgi:hypothetical protein
VRVERLALERELLLDFDLDLPAQCVLRARRSGKYRRSNAEKGRDGKPAELRLRITPPRRHRQRIP